MGLKKNFRTLNDSEPRLPFPAKKLKRPGLEAELLPKPRFKGERYRAAGKLIDKVALITGGDSGIGRAVAVFFAKEGADVAINYLKAEQVDALHTKKCIEAIGRRCELIPGDLTNAAFCSKLVDKTVKTFGQLDILVSNAAYQNRKSSIEEISDKEWERTFQTNVSALFHLTKSAMKHLKRGSSIIVTSSETGLFGSEKLLDYSATKGAINGFVKALAQNVVEKGIRVNAVAPGPVWTPLNPSDRGLSARKVAQFGKKTLFKRPAQPEEIAPAYVFLASEADSSFITGHVLPIIGDQTSA